MGRGPIRNRPQEVLPVTFRLGDERRGSIRQALKSGDVIRIRPGVYGYPAEFQELETYSRQRHLMLLDISAARGTMPNTAVFSHVSAALLWGLPVVTPRGRPHLTDPHYGGGASAYERRHRSDVPSEQVARLSGCAVTTLERTVVDCLRILSPAEGFVIADAALQCGLDRDEALRINSTLLLPRYRHRTETVLRFADARSASPGESRLRYMAILAGLPGLEPQVRVPHKEGYYELDLGIRAVRLGLEYDGLGKYVGDALRAEKVREHRLRDAGWNLVRFIGEDLRRPHDVVAKLRQEAARLGVTEFVPAPAVLAASPQHLPPRS